MENKLKISSTVLSLLVAILAIISIMQLFEKKQLESRIIERDEYLESLIERDSTIILRDSIIQTIHKTIETFFWVGEQKMNSDEFLEYVNSLYKEIDDQKKEIKNLKDSLNYYRNYYSLSQAVYGNEFGVTEASHGRTYKLTYASKDTLSIDEVNQLRYDRQKLKAILRKYNIHINETESSFTIESPNIDSALLLLPYYRHKLEYIPDKDLWEITLDRRSRR